MMRAGPAMIWAIGDSGPGALGVVVPGVVEAASPSGGLELTTARMRVLDVVDAVPVAVAGGGVAAGAAEPDPVEFSAAAPDVAAGGCPGGATAPEVAGPAVVPPAPLEFEVLVSFEIGVSFGVWFEVGVSFEVGVVRPAPSRWAR